MNENEKVADYIAKIISYTQRLKDIKMEQNSAVVIAKILGSLPQRFDNVICCKRVTNHRETHRSSSQRKNTPERKIINKRGQALVARGKQDVQRDNENMRMYNFE